MLNQVAPTALQRLINSMQIHRRSAQSDCHHLLLTSSISLTEEVQHAICGSSRWDDFRQYIQEMGEDERIATLNYYLSPPRCNAGYLALARLIKNGYFSTILTANIDSGLEEALATEGISSADIQILIPDRDSDSSIRKALSEPTHAIRIMKLYGSLRERVLTHKFPDVLELHKAICENIRTYLASDLVVVGRLDYDRGIAHKLPADDPHDLYYAISHEPAPQDQVLTTLETRQQAVAHFVIDGIPGIFNNFFTELATSLLDDSTGHTLSDEDTSKSPADNMAPSSLATRTVVQPPRADVLLVTVTEIETKAVFHALQSNYGRQYRRRSVQHKAYYDLGNIEGAQIYLIQSEMSSSDPGTSILTIHDSIHTLQPGAIIMLGISFGFSAARFRIGDVLVARQLLNYEIQHTNSTTDGTSIIRPHGDRVNATASLLSKFRSGIYDWSGQSVHFGLMLSGEKLLASKTEHDQLRALEPEAMGGEIEGAGLYAVAHYHKIDWIVVKAISDWADGRKGRHQKQRQKLAAGNAAQFTFHVLEHGGFHNI